MGHRAKRIRFRRNLLVGLQVIGPVLWAVLGLILGLGILVGLREGWSILDSVYFSFITGLTIGYGDLAPKSTLGRMLAILIGVYGIILTGLIAAVAVRAMSNVHDTTDI